MPNALDRFSAVARDYARYRPKYPAALYEFLFSFVSARTCAWDAGTGNGQVAAVLSQNFSKVIATDISSAQLASAVQAANIDYRVCPAEASGITSTSVNLITVAQAAHWFSMQSFAHEVARVAAPGAVLAMWGYTLFRSEPDIDAIIDHLYGHILDGFWDPHRDLVDRHYKDFDLPFEETGCPDFIMEKTWNAEDILGYLGTWSAVNKYRAALHRDPIDEIRDPLKRAMHGNHVTCRTPLFMRTWRI